MGEPTRLPSIRSLSLGAAAVVLVPLVIFGTIQFRKTSEQVELTERIQDQAVELEQMISLMEAISDEAVLSTMSRVLPEIGIPVDLVPVLGDRGADGSVSIARESTDELLELLDDPVLRAAVAETRVGLDRRQSLAADVVVAYDALLHAVSARLTGQATRLEETAAAAGIEPLITATGAVEATANVTLSTRQLVARWALIFPRAHVQVPPAFVEAADRELVHHRFWVERLEGTLSDRDALAQQWEALRDDDDHRQLFEVYRAISTDYRANGTGIDVERFAYDFRTMSSLTLINIGAKLGQILSLDAGLRSDLGDFTDVMFDHLDEEVASAAADASRTRVQAIGLGAVGAGLIVALAGAVIVLVARPTVEFRETVQSLRNGRPRPRIAERGPTEIRLAARALNEAIGTLQIVEAQATALAEERLNDPVLQEDAPGRLGASLQDAVHRLASSLAEREEFRRHLSQSVSRDPLTNLANRIAVVGRLSSALARSRRTSTSVAILVIDVDRFKSFNDAQGHEAGDMALRTVAKRLTGSLREGDLAGRLGGDQFAVVAEAVNDLDEVMGLARRIKANLDEPVTIDNRSFRIRVCIGVGVGLGQGGADLTPDELLRDAGLAVLRAKESGGDRIDVCDDEVRAELDRHLTVEQAIRRGLTNGEFALWFQPSVRASDGRIHAVESLIRWNGQPPRPASPQELIRVAEHSDLILEIDRWAIDEAVRHLAAWRSHPVLGSASVAVNVSARHMGNGGMCAVVKDALDRHGVAPERLIVEITETAALEDLEGTAIELHQLRGLGVRAALDDFGTGYMSLAHLRGLTFDILKIDRSFVSDIDNETNRSLVRLIAETGRMLGATVTAEGVETEHQARILTSLGSDHLQGYHFGRPVDRSTLEDTSMTASWGALRDRRQPEPMASSEVS